MKYVFSDGTRQRTVTGPYAEDPKNDKAFATAMMEGFGIDVSKVELVSVTPEAGEPGCRCSTTPDMFSGVQG